MKKAYRLLFSLHLFVGVGAIAGGLAMVLNPQEPLGVSVKLLGNSPFNNYNAVAYYKTARYDIIL